MKKLLFNLLGMDNLLDRIEMCENRADRLEADLRAAESIAVELLEHKRLATPLMYTSSGYIQREPYTYLGGSTSEGNTS